jgi:hypothetical protein
VNRSTLRRAAARALKTAALGATLLAPSAAHAIGDPDLRWQTIETPHFRVHSPTTLDPVATRVASLSESIQARLGEALGYVPSGVTHIVITDDTDSANGSATALPFNVIRLYATAPEDLSPLGDYDDWYLDLVTHEDTHILHIDNVSGVSSLVNAILGKTLAYNQIQPRWIIEGLAVLNESHQTSAGRLRSALFDMYLRADVLGDRIAGLDQISSSALRWPQGNLWYLYGSRFLGWITDVYGPNTMRAVSADYGSTVLPWGINRSIRRATGKTYEELYDGFKAYLKLRYAQQVSAVEARGLREGTRLTHHGRNVLYPRFVPGVARAGQADEIVYYVSDYNAREGLYRLTLNAKRDAPAKKPELFARTNGASGVSFSPAGDAYFYSNAPWKIVYNRNDLFRVPHGEQAKRGDEPWRAQLTQGLRASNPDVSPDGKRIAFTVNTKGTTYLEIADIDPEGVLQNRRDLVPSARFEQAYTPRFSPDGRSVAYSAWTAGGYRDIRVVDIATGTFRQITHDRALDANPVWSPDGKQIYFSSDRSGIPNIYAYGVEKGDLRQVTNVRIGALQPAISSDGKTLVYIGYTSLGFDLYAMPIDPARFLDAPPAPADRPDPPPTPEPVALKRVPYNPLRTLAPRSYEVSYAPGSYSNSALTLSARGSDVAGMHSLGATLTADFGAPAPRLTLDYSYRRLPVDLGLRFFSTVAPRSGYRINGKNTLYDEYANGITSSLSYAIPREFNTQSFGLSYSLASYRGNFPVGDKLDPYAPITRKPPEGMLGIVHVGYGFSNVESSLDAAGNIRGLTMRLGVDYAGPTTGSTASLYAFEGSINGYVQMPWHPLHTLAMRFAGGTSGGDYARSGIYYVGGWDLQSYDLIDSVTTGVYDGAFVLRGFAPRSAVGRSYVQQNVEYRFPIIKPDHGISTLPAYLRRIDGNVFLDWGGAFDKLELDKIQLFHQGLLYSQQLFTSVGAELWFGATFGYFLSAQFRLGYAHGFGGAAIPGGQFYFIASSAF